MKKFFALLLMTCFVATICCCTYFSRNNVSNISLKKNYDSNKHQHTNICASSSAMHQETPDNKFIANEGDTEWEQVSRRVWTQATIKSFISNSGKLPVLTLKIEKNYHSATDPIQDEDFPFTKGEVVTFVLKNKPSIDLNIGKRVIVFESQVTKNDKDNYLGIEKIYYENEGKYYNENGKIVKIPPETY